MPRISKIMMARLFVRSQRKDMSDKAGKRASMTLGIVSPTITQKATMPPNALLCVSGLVPFACMLHVQ